MLVPSGRTVTAPAPSATRVAPVVARLKSATVTPVTVARADVGLELSRKVATTDRVWVVPSKLEVSVGTAGR